jgi:hypothetical protein
MQTTDMFARTLASLIVDIVYGFRIESMNDDYIKAAVESIDVFSESHLSGRFWIDVMPWLRYIPSWIPGTDAVRYGTYWRPRIAKTINTPFDAILSGKVSSHFI